MTNESRSKLEKSKDEVGTTQEDGVVNSILEIDNDLKENLFMCIWTGFIADHKNACSVEGKSLSSSSSSSSSSYKKNINS